MSTRKSKAVLHWTRDHIRSEYHHLIEEEPLSIRVEGKPYSVLMRTPGDELPLTAGFCLAEGLVDNQDDFASLGFCDGQDTNVVTVTLKPARRGKISAFLDRRGFISQTSCGICGKAIVEDLYQNVSPITDRRSIGIEQARNALLQLTKHQRLYRRTRATHAALLCDVHLNVLAVAEDVGRHNALDKVIGKLLLDGRLPTAAIVALTSRVSYEMVQKAARARIPILLAFSRPTAIAVDLAERLNLTLATQSKGSGLFVFTGTHRLPAKEVS